MMIDPEARYLESHEWAKKEGENVFVVGLTPYAIEQLGDIVYMELPEVGREVAAGEPFGVIESVKAASDIYAPLPGEIVEVHADVPDNPDRLKKDAYAGGWLIKIKVTDTGRFDGLIDAEQYERFLKGIE